MHDFIHISQLYLWKKKITNCDFIDLYSYEFRFLDNQSSVLLPRNVSNLDMASLVVKPPFYAISNTFSIISHHFEKNLESEDDFRQVLPYLSSNDWMDGFPAMPSWNSFQSSETEVWDLLIWNLISFKCCADVDGNDWEGGITAGIEVIVGWSWTLVSDCLSIFSHIEAIPEKISSYVPCEKIDSLLYRITAYFLYKPYM